MLFIIMVFVFRKQKKQIKSKSHFSMNKITRLLVAIKYTV